MPRSANKIIEIGYRGGGESPSNNEKYSGRWRQIILWALVFSKERHCLSQKSMAWRADCWAQRDRTLVVQKSYMFPQGVELSPSLVYCCEQFIDVTLRLNCVW